MATATARKATLFQTASSAAGSTVSYLTELLGRIARGFRDMGLVLGLASCQTEGAKPTPVEPAIQLPVTVAEPKSEEPKALGDFSITFYYVVGEDEVVAKKKPTPANDNALIGGGAESGIELAAAMLPDEPPEPELVHVYSPECESLAEVTREFASALTMQGTGKLRDGRIINIWGKCECERSPCFKITDNQWGTSGSGRPLQPFRTVAVDPKVIKLGSLLYVPILDGRTMPGRAPWGGYVHDGCVTADDTGGGIDGHQLDLFVGRRAYYLGVSGKAGSHAWAKHVPVFDGAGRCERKGRVVSRKSGSS